MRRPAPLALAALATAGAAHAEPYRCSTADADLAFDGVDVAELTGDTGWFPSGYAAQVRIAGRVAGQTFVAMGLQPTLCWDGGGERMTATLPGRAGTGLLDVAYGAEVHLYGHIDTTVLGIHVFWEGEIPIPFIPEDLILADTGAFDPALGDSASVYDTTDPIPLLSTDVIGALISITGISGGLYLDVSGAMATTYAPNAMTAGDASITTAGGSAEVPRPDPGWGPAVELPLGVDGLVRYEPSLIFTIGLDIKIFGIRVVDYQLFGVPLALPAIDRRVAMAGGAHVPLPELAALGEGARIDFATGPTQELAIANRGEAPLSIEVAAAPPGITTDPIATLAAGAESRLRVTASAEAMTAGTLGPLVLATSDPDHPTLSVALGVDVGGSDQGDPIDPEPSAGCAAGGGDGGMILVLVLGLSLTGCTRRRSTGRSAARGCSSASRSPRCR